MKTIPYGRQHIDERDIVRVLKVLKSDWITQGPMIGEFEQALCKYTGARYAVAVSSGTAALHLACLAAGIAKGDQVITSPLTFAATSNSVLYCQGVPVFADVDADTANIIPEEIEKKLTRKTKAIIPVHFSGLPVDLAKIARIASKNKLMVIEDAAHALGASYRGEKIGSCRYSDMAIFSFHPVKSITTAEGGAILTNSPGLYKKLSMLRTHGIVKSAALSRKIGAWFYQMQALGYNYRITDLQAALGLSQMSKLDGFIARRRQVTAIYNKEFAGSPWLDIPAQSQGCLSSCHLYPLKLKKEFAYARKEIFSRLRSSGLGVQVHYLPVYLHPYYQKLGYRKGLCPQAESFYAREISIPLYPDIKNKEINYVVKKIKEICNDTLL